MNLTDYAIIAAIGLLPAVGQYLLKIGVGAAFNNPAAAVGSRRPADPEPAGRHRLHIAFAIYLLVLAKSDVSQIFPVAIGVNILCVAMMAALSGRRSPSRASSAWL